MIHLDYRDPRPVKVLKKMSRMAALRLRNKRSKDSILGDAPITLSLTSYGERLKTVWYTIESLSQGDTLPSRFILWVDENSGFDVVDYPELARLAKRGLEIRETRGDYGPHKKSYPYSVMTDGEENLLVNSDDDLIYPSEWLKTLYEASLAYPGEFLGLRAHNITLTADGEVVPYTDWAKGERFEALHSNFLTTGAGCIITPEMQKIIASAGEDFLEKAPKADDIWVNLLAVKHGIKRRLIDGKEMQLVSVPRTQATALHHSNVGSNQNDVQFAATASSVDIKTIAQDAPRV